MSDIPSIEILWAPASAALAASPRDPALVENAFNLVQQQDGFLKIYWGLQVEDKQTSYQIVAWKSLEHHRKLEQNTEAVAKLAEAVKPLFDTPEGKPIEYIHVEPTSAPYKAFEAPVLEMATFVLKQGQKKEELDAFLDELVAACNAIPQEEGAYGAAWGRIVENVDTMVVMFVGWATREAHYENVDKYPIFAELKPRAQALSDYVAIHIPLKQYQ